MRFLTILFLFGSLLTLPAAQISVERAETARLQIFLDQQNFGPGVIDGKIGTYTRMAIQAYNKKFGRRDDQADQVKDDAMQAIPEIYATAIVPDIARKMVDRRFKWGSNREYQASRKDMPYRSIGEFMAERYHTSIEFLKLINGSKKVNNATVRSALLVPNVEPFRIELLAEGRSYKSDDILSERWVVIDTKKHQIRIYDPVDLPEDVVVAPPAPGQEESTPTDDEPDAPDEEILENFSPIEAAPLEIEEELEPAEEGDCPAVGRAMIIEDDSEPIPQLTAHDEHRALIVAAFPITPGKPQFIRYGTWKMLNSVEFPTWRFDKSLLKTGKRSKESLQIPSGPNNPVGVHWMGLSRRGIGIHGTNNPEKIGRGRSAGCIRMANWDVVKLPKLVRPGATVIIK